MKIANFLKTQRKNSRFRQNHKRGLPKMGRIKKAAVTARQQAQSSPNIHIELCFPKEVKVVPMKNEDKGGNSPKLDIILYTSSSLYCGL